MLLLAGKTVSAHHAWRNAGMKAHKVSWAFAAFNQIILHFLSLGLTREVNQQYLRQQWTKHYKISCQMQQVLTLCGAEASHADGGVHTVYTLCYVVV